MPLLMRRSLLPVTCLMLLLVLALAPSSLAKGDKHVTIKGSYGVYHFSPKTVTIKKGKTVHWAWSSDAQHNVTFGPKLNGKHSKTKANITDFKVTFNNTGTFNYRCTVHDFHGKVVVENP
jgi:plastocyanin